MVAAREQSPKLTPEAYFAWEELALKLTTEVKNSSFISDRLV